MKRKSPNKPSTRHCAFETLEERQHFSVYTVTNPVDGQPGSLRAIIQYANAHPTSAINQIDFAVGVNRGPVTLSFNPSLGQLPPITGRVDIEGNTQDPSSNQPVTLKGCGLTLPTTGDNVNDLTISTSAFGINVRNCDFVSIENCSFFISGNGVAVELVNSSNDVLQNLTATGNHLGCGLFVTGTCHNDDFLSVNADYFKQGVVLGGGTGDNVFYQGTMSHNSGAGITDSGAENGFENLSITSNGGDGLYECGVDEQLQSNTFSSNGQNGIEFGPSSFSQSRTDIGYVWGSQIFNNGRNGILVDGQDRLSIGQPVSPTGNSDANTIDHNAANGIEVLADTAPVTISDNSIFANSGIGIDLAQGSNPAANTPTINWVTCSDGTTTITGTEACAPGTQLTLQFYESSAGSSNEGDILLGQWVGTGTPESSNPNISSFSVTFSTPSIVGESVTAISETPESSAFSNAVTASEFYLPFKLSPIVRISPIVGATLLKPGAGELRVA